MVEDVEEVSVDQTEEQEERPKEKQSKKKSTAGRVFKWVGLGVGSFLLAALLYLGWLGFVPGLSGILGADNPKDLGVTYTEADLRSFYDKTEQKLLDYDNAPVRDGKKVIFDNPKSFTMPVTQEEITARINDSNWAYMPVKNVQIRLSDGNSIEVSGNVDVAALESFIPFIGGVGYSQEDVDTGLSWLRRMAGSPSFYIDSVGSINNNQLSLEIKGVQIGRWSAPLAEASNVLTTATTNALAGATGLDVRSATFNDGVLNFDGAAATTIYVKK